MRTIDAKNKKDAAAISTERKVLAAEIADPSLNVIIVRGESTEKRRARPDAVVQQFEQVIAFGSAHGGDGEVVDHPRVEPCQLSQAPCKAAVLVRHLQFVKQPCRAHVQHREAAARSLVPQPARFNRCGWRP